MKKQNIRCAVTKCPDCGKFTDYHRDYCEYCGSRI